MRKNKKGFTLAELLIVVAIIAVLVAIAIPIFTTQLEKSREATDAANARDYYAEIATALLDGHFTDSGATGTSDTVKVGNNLDAEIAGFNAATTAGATFTVTVSSITVAQAQNDWQGPTPTVAGVVLAAWDVSNSDLEFEFTLDSELDAYLSGVTLK